MFKSLTFVSLLFASAVALAAIPENTSTDLEMTQRLHDALILRTDISTWGQNIRIVTLGGKTVLSGPVASIAEKRKIDALARAVLGKEAQIDDELTIAQ